MASGDDTQPAFFGRSDAKRIANVVRQVEGTPVDGVGRRNGQQYGQLETILAQITDDDGANPPELYSWEEVRRTTGGGWDTPEDGRTGAWDGDYAAFPLDPDTRFEVGEVVLLRRAMQLGEDGELQWAIIGSPGQVRAGSLSCDLGEDPTNPALIAGYVDDPVDAIDFYIGDFITDTVETVDGLTRELVFWKGFDVHQVVYGDDDYVVECATKILRFDSQESAENPIDHTDKIGVPVEWDGLDHGEMTRRCNCPQETGTNYALIAGTAYVPAKTICVVTDVTCDPDTGELVVTKTQVKVLDIFAGAPEDDPCGSYLA